jgi:glycerophosphoryl diester phosphodiesterase
MLIWGHRGASADAPENTLTAFREALRQGADGVELDARVCGSGEVVVCHDESLERLANQPWEVGRTPLSQLRQADVGTPLGFGPERIPTLTEVMDLFPPDFWINIELKSDGWGDRGLARKVAELLAARPTLRNVVVSSFNPVCLVRFARHAPAVARGFLIDPDKGQLFQRRVLVPLLARETVHPHESACTPQAVAAWRARGYRVNTWTVDSPERARALQALGVEGCITNRPGALRAALGQ